MQAVHVAAQYGQTAFINHLVAKYHADFDAPDRDGRSPLHWYVKMLWLMDMDMILVFGCRPGKSSYIILEFFSYRREFFCLCLHNGELTKYLFIF